MVSNEIHATSGKMVSLCLCGIVALVLGIVLCMPQQAYAAAEASDSGLKAAAATELSTQAQKNLKQLGVKFNLKANKVYTFKSTLRGVGKIDYAVKVSNLKIKKTKEAGYKQATFKTTSILKTRLTSAQAKSVLKAQKRVNYDWTQMITPLFYHVVDFKTGQNLEDSTNKAGVEAEFTTVESVPDKTYTDTDGSWFHLGKKVVQECTIVYPSSYDGVCLGIGPSLTYPANMFKADHEFEYTEGTKYRYQHTSWYKKLNNQYRFMRIK